MNRTPAARRATPSPPPCPVIAAAAQAAAAVLREARAHQAAQEVLALWQQSGLPEAIFLRHMDQARLAVRPAFGASTPFRDALRARVRPAA
jgi:hypothetical protein